MTEFFEATGLVAAVFTTLAFLPQVLATWRAGSAEGLSLLMLSVLASGILLWLVYGIGTGQLPVIAANGATLLLVAILLGIKLNDRVRAARSRVRRVR